MREEWLEIRETEELQAHTMQMNYLDCGLTICPAVSLKASWNINLYSTFTGILTERNINLYFITGVYLLET